MVARCPGEFSSCACCIVCSAVQRGVASSCVVCVLEARAQSSSPVAHTITHKHSVLCSSATVRNAHRRRLRRHIFSQVAHALRNLMSGCC